MGLDGYCLTVYRIMSELVHKFLKVLITHVLWAKAIPARLGEAGGLADSSTLQKRDLKSRGRKTK